MPELRAILFDAGHTLFWYPNWAQVYRRSLESVRARIGHLGFDVGTFRVQSAIEDAARGPDNTVPSMEEQFRTVLCSLGVSKYDSVDIMSLRDAYWSPIIQKACARKGGPQLLSDLKKAGFKLGLVSNFWKPALISILERLDLENCFDAIVTSIELGFKKPHPNIFHSALDSIQTRPSQAAMVGDDPEADVLGAHRLGMLTIRLTRGPHRTKPNLVEPYCAINNLSALRTILCKHGPSKRRKQV
ncbi:MAG: HAD family hydrolase [Candidatus Thorarchaeota archaeon]